MWPFSPKTLDRFSNALHHTCSCYSRSQGFCACGIERSESRQRSAPARIFKGEFNLNVASPLRNTHRFTASVNSNLLIYCIPVQYPFWEAEHWQMWTSSIFHRVSMVPGHLRFSWLHTIRYAVTPVTVSVLPSLKPNHASRFVFEGLSDLVRRNSYIL